MRRSKIQGVALITVMLVVALAAVIATQMLARLQLQVQRTTNINFNQQAYWYAMGAEALAKRVLITSFKEEKDFTHLGQIWAQGETTYPVDFGEISGEITDLHACFNLNALKGKENRNINQNQTSENQRVHDAFKALIMAIDVEGIDDFEAENMTNALADWLDDNSALRSGDSAEDNDYAAKEFGYLPANNYLASVNELRVIVNFTVPVINELKKHVCIIPNSNLHQVNINTLSNEQPELLQALLSVSRDEAEQILSARDADGYKNIEVFFNLPEVSKIENIEDKKQQFVVDSEYFKLKAKANFNNSYFQLNSTLHVANNNKISVISRTIGRD
ncbi:type II secretion system minor pseudopilin GspK [Colwelliaceae bacterium 6441]